MPYEDISAPSAFVGWGTQAGQVVEGRLVDWTPDGGTTFNGDTCPQITLELVAPAKSYDKEGRESTFEAGELVAVTCGQVKLRGAFRREIPTGAMVRIEMTGTRKTANGTMKEFACGVDRSTADLASYQAAPTHTPASATTVAPVATATPAVAPSPAVKAADDPELSPELAAALQKALAARGQA